MPPTTSTPQIVTNCAAALSGLSDLSTSVQNATLPASLQGDYSKAVAALLPIIDEIREFAAPGSTDDDFDPADLGESAVRARESWRVPGGMTFTFDDPLRSVRESSVPRGMTFTFDAA